MLCRKLLRSRRLWGYMVSLYMVFRSAKSRKDAAAGIGVHTQTEPEVYKELQQACI